MWSAASLSVPTYLYRILRLVPLVVWDWMLTHFAPVDHNLLFAIYLVMGGRVRTETRKRMTYWGKQKPV